MSGPAQPVKVGTYPIPIRLGGLDGVTLDGRYAFVNEYGWEGFSAGAVVLDVSNPARPWPIGRSPSPELGRSIAQNGFLFSAQAELGLTVRSLPGPLTMVEAPQGEGVLFGEPTELTVGVYSTSAVQYQWYIGASGDISRPVPNATGPVLSLPPVWETSSYWVRVKNESGQLDSQTVATRPAPALDLKQLGRNPRLNDGTLSLALGEHRAYLVEADTFRVLDVSNWARAIELGQLKLAVTNTTGLTVTEPNAYVWTTDGILQRIDVSDAAHPRLTGRYSTAGGNIYQLIAPSASSTTSPPRAYLAAGSEGLITLDVSDSTELRRLSTYMFNTPVVGIAATGNHAMAVTAEPGSSGISAFAQIWRGDTLKVMDFHDPAHPQVVGSYTPENMSPRFVGTVLVSGHYALVNLGAFLWKDSPIPDLQIPDFQILDIKDPVHPQLISSARNFGSLVAVDATRAFLSYDGDSGSVIQAVDFTDPTSPVLVGSFSITNTLSGFAVRGNNVFIADSKSGLLSAELSAQLRVFAPALGRDTATLRWTGAPGVVLQQTHSLTDPAWQDLGGTDDRSRIDLPRTLQPAFFRAVQR